MNIEVPFACVLYQESIEKFLMLSQELVDIGDRETAEIVLKYLSWLSILPPASTPPDKSNDKQANREKKERDVLRRMF